MEKLGYKEQRITHGHPFPNGWGDRQGGPISFSPYPKILPPSCLPTFSDHAFFVKVCCRAGNVRLPDFSDRVQSECDPIDNGQPSPKSRADMVSSRSLLSPLCIRLDTLPYNKSSSSVFMSSIGPYPPSNQPNNCHLWRREQCTSNRKQDLFSYTECIPSFLASCLSLTSERMENQRETPTPPFWSPYYPKRPYGCLPATKTKKHRTCEVKRLPWACISS